MVTTATSDLHCIIKHMPSAFTVLFVELELRAYTQWMQTLPNRRMLCSKLLNCVVYLVVLWDNGAKKGCDECHLQVCVYIGNQCAFFFCMKKVSDS